MANSTARPAAGAGPSPCSPLSRHWSLDPAVDFLNHGSYGACPRATLDAQNRVRAQLERGPVQFMLHGIFEHLDSSRVRLAEFVQCEPEGLAFVTNATTGVNTIVAGLEFEPGDELLVTQHAYYACRRAFEAHARRRGLVVRTVDIPLACADDEIITRVEAAITSRTRLALIDHVSSATATIFPVCQLIERLRAHSVFSLIDGAHAPGMVPVDLEALRPDAYVANCHKWICAPKGSAFIHLAQGLRERISPLVTSYGAELNTPNRSDFHREFDWQGTHDPSAFACVGFALDHMAGLYPGGWPAIRAHNHDLVLAGRETIVDGLIAAKIIRAEVREQLPAACQIGSMATIPLPPRTRALKADTLDPLYVQLLQRKLEVPVYCWPNPPDRWLRISAQLYNHIDQYRRLRDALIDIFT